MDEKLSVEQKAYFKNSKFRENGELLRGYHGSGIKIEAFDPAFTGQGSDQYGSGFYFSTSREGAEMYTTSRNKDMTGKEISKLGGEENPSVIEVYLNIENPIMCNDFEQSNLSHVLIPNNKVYDIVKRLPTLYHLSTDEVAPNPLTDYSEKFWDVDPQTKEEFEPLIKEMVEKHFQDTDLRALDVFFGKNGTELRNAIHEELGYDGVIVNFDKNNLSSKKEKHAIAWFPEQIKDVNNLCPQHTNKLMDKTQEERFWDNSIDERMMDYSNKNRNTNDKLTSKQTSIKENAQRATDKANANKSTAQCNIKRSNEPER